MAFWRRIKGLFVESADDSPSVDESSAAEADEVAKDNHDTTSKMLIELADTSCTIDPDAIKDAVETMRRTGREIKVVELLSRALRARPNEEELQAALALLHVARLDDDAAVPLLETLTRSMKYGITAELLLGESAERTGDLSEALRRYERVLAKDVTHSHALNSARRLRDRLGSSAPAATHATVVQPEGVATQGRYQLIRELGRGGSAVVYVALDRHLEREVALKVYHPQVMREDGPQQLAREAALPARVGHPGIIKVLDVDAKIGALVMELIHGGTIKEILNRGQMDTITALIVLEAVCRPLAALHELGIVHRDIKPGNILLRNSSFDDPVLTDLGVALLAGEEHRPGIGTIAFMAPEQRTGKDVDARADVYAAGVMLAAMLGGYPGPTGPVGDLLDRCLSESPGGRPSDAVELGQIVASIRRVEERNEEFRTDLKHIADLSGQ